MRRLLAGLVLVAGCAWGQNGFHYEKPTPNSPDSEAVAVKNEMLGPQHTIEDGTPVRLRLKQTLSSGDLQIGEKVRFEVLDAVTVNGAVLIPGGATALASVTEAQEKRRMGRAGKLALSLDYVRAASGERVRLRGEKANKGGGNVGKVTGAVVATTVVAWPLAPLWLLAHGKDARIPEGLELIAFVNGDQLVHALR
jgi:hypothetical protein